MLFKQYQIGVLYWLAILVQLGVWMGSQALGPWKFSQAAVLLRQYKPLCRTDN